MDKKDSEKLISLLNAKWRSNPCPMCGVRGWAVLDKVFELREFHGGALVLGSGPIIPIVPVTCNNCGNTIFINAIKAGIVDAEPKKEGEKNG